jgi:hypothetical protein
MTWHFTANQIRLFGGVLKSHRLSLETLLVSIELDEMQVGQLQPNNCPERSRLWTPEFYNTSRVFRPEFSREIQYWYRYYTIPALASSMQN